MDIICGFSSAHLYSVSEPTGAKCVKADGKAQQYSETLHFACLSRSGHVRQKTTPNTRDRFASPSSLGYVASLSRRLLL